MLVQGPSLGAWALFGSLEPSRHCSSPSPSRPPLGPRGCWSCLPAEGRTSETWVSPGPCSALLQSHSILLAAGASGEWKRRERSAMVAESWTTSRLLHSLPSFVAAALNRLPWLQPAPSPPLEPSAPAGSPGPICIRQNLPATLLSQTPGLPSNTQHTLTHTPRTHSHRLMLHYCSHTHICSRSCSEAHACSHLDTHTHIYTHSHTLTTANTHTHTKHPPTNKLLSHVHALAQTHSHVHTYNTLAHPRIDAQNTRVCTFAHMPMQGCGCARAHTHTPCCACL